MTPVAARGLPGTRSCLLSATALLALLPLFGCGGPPADREEARARVEAAAESLRAAHEETWGVATEEERLRVRTDSAAVEGGAAAER